MDSATTESSASVGFRLWRVLVVGAAILFATLLIGLTGDIGLYWPLYVIPVILAAVFFHVPGLVLAAAACGGAVALVAPSGALSGSGGVQILVGFAAILVAGSTVGVSSSRSSRHAIALEQASFRDEETGLYKPTYMRRRLIEEVRRAQRHDVAVGLLVVRLDGLAVFRETFGAYKTGLLMEHLADVLRITVRDTDVVGRYGPESFGVIMPFAGPAEAILVADRVRIAACEAEFEGDVLQPSAHCPVSVAAVALPAEASTVEELVAIAADRLADTAPDFDSPKTAGSFRLGEVRP
jgi:diguanylate cyclase (GGDEF)-like protein